MLNYVNKAKMAIIAMVIMVFVSGCVAGSSNKVVVDSSYKILKTTQIAYDNAMKTTAMLWRNGKVTDAQKDEVIAKGKEFVKSYKVLARVLEMYAEGVDSPLTIEQATANFVTINTALMMLVREVVADEY